MPTGHEKTSASSYGRSALACARRVRFPTGREPPRGADTPSSDRFAARASRSGDTPAFLFSFFAVASWLRARSRSLRTSLRLSRLDKQPFSACRASASIIGCVQSFSYGAESSVFLTRATPPLRQPPTPHWLKAEHLGVRRRRAGGRLGDVMSDLSAACTAACLGQCRESRATKAQRAESACSTRRTSRPKQVDRATPALYIWYNVRQCRCYENTKHTFLPVSVETVAR